MKAIKICIIACTLGFFATSCRNKDCNTTTMANETVAPATATSITDGTQAATVTPADTPSQNVAGMNATERESTARTKGNKTPGRNRVVREDMSARAGTGNGSTPAEVDLKATKKREANFTHGTGSENTGR